MISLFSITVSLPCRANLMNHQFSVFDLISASKKKLTLLETISVQRTGYANPGFCKTKKSHIELQRGQVEFASICDGDIKCSTCVMSTVKAFTGIKNYFCWYMTYQNDRVHSSRRAHYHREDKGYAFSNRKIAQDYVDCVALGRTKVGEDFKLAHSLSKSAGRRRRLVWPATLTRGQQDQGRYNVFCRVKVKQNTFFRTTKVSDTSYKNILSIKKKESISSFIAEKAL
ncbi:hypothetical protein EDC96DRAFT_567689 [Choanephora cucurbitarum]|nr:hypothetical protein EDC96DRAFT_567689 [Choanephora cucurbitarum]